MSDTPTDGRPWYDRPVFRYLLVGGFNTGLDIGIYTLLATVFHVHPLVSNVISTLITLCVSYGLNRFFVFQSERSVAQTFIQFVTVTLFSGLLVQSGVIWVVINLGQWLAPGLNAGLLAVGAKLCAVCVGMVSNFLGYRWLFSHRGEQPANLGE